jgi:hypothetical protein
MSKEAGMRFQSTRRTQHANTAKTESFYCNSSNLPAELDLNLSGHTGFGGALFQILRRFYRTDAIAFTFVSNEFNGVTRDYNGNVRPLLSYARSHRSPRLRRRMDRAAFILGIHWRFDKTAGIAQGRHVADYVFKNAFKPLR